MNNKQRISYIVAFASFVGAIICGTEWMTTPGFDNTWKALTLAFGAFAVVASVGAWTSGLPRREDAAGNESD